MAPPRGQRSGDGSSLCGNVSRWFNVTRLGRPRDGSAKQQLCQPPFQGCRGEPQCCFPCWIGRCGPSGSRLLVRQGRTSHFGTAPLPAQQALPTRYQDVTRNRSPPPIFSDQCQLDKKFLSSSFQVLWSTFHLRASNHRTLWGQSEDPTGWSLCKGGFLSNSERFLS